MDTDKKDGDIITGWDKDIWKLIDDFFVVDGKEHYVSGLSNDVQALITDLLTRQAEMTEKRVRGETIDECREIINKYKPTTQEIADAIGGPHEHILGYCFGQMHEAVKEINKLSNLKT